MLRLSSHFTLDEFIISQEAARRGIDNTPPPEVIEKLRKTAQGLEAVRVSLSCAPILISSGYRCLALNRLLGSQDTSQHVLGEAADFTSPGFGSASVVAYALRDGGIEYDQLILEFDRWVHISFSDRRRHQALVIDKAGTRPM